MTRLVLIHDEMKRSYLLVTGQSRVEIVLRKTVERRNAGYSLVLDTELPVYQTVPLDLGKVKGTVLLDIRCMGSLERTIDERQQQALQMLIGNGADRFRYQIEKLVSRVKVRVVQQSRNPLDQSLAVSLIFPYIIAGLRELLVMAREEPNLPFLMFNLSDSLNQSASVDGLIEADNRAQEKLLIDVATRQLTSAYPPEEELRMAREHADQLMAQWPMSQPLVVSDVSQLLPFIEEENDAFAEELFLVAPRQSFLGRLLGGGQKH
jgi:hypothetical protein